MAHLPKVTVQFHIPDLSKLQQPPAGEEARTREDVDDVIHNMAALVHTLRTQRNSLVPINKLPPEMLSRIFVYRAFSEEDGVTLWLPQVTHICHYWRSTAHSCAKLWSYIKIANPSSWDAIHTMITLSKESLLTIECDSATPERDFLKMAPAFNFMKRVQNICMHISDCSSSALAGQLKEPAPFLKSLDLTYDGSNDNYMTWSSFDAKTPRLHTLKLKNFCIPQAPLFWTGISESLTCLVLESSSTPALVYDFIRVLGALPNLQKLVLDDALESGTISNLHSAPGVHLPHLSYFLLHANDDATSTIFQKVTFPLLTRLDFHFLSDPYYSGILSASFPILAPNFVALSANRGISVELCHAALDIRVNDGGAILASFLLDYISEQVPLSIIQNAYFWTGISPSLTFLLIHHPDEPIPISDMLVVLGRLPNLQQIMFYNAIVRDISSVSSSLVTARLPQLSSFQLHEESHVGDLLLQNVIFPSSTVLGIYYDQSQHPQPEVPLVAISRLVINFAMFSGKYKFKFEQKSLALELNTLAKGGFLSYFTVFRKNGIQASTISSFVRLFQPFFVQTLEIRQHPYRIEVPSAISLQDFADLKTLVLTGSNMKPIISSLSVGSAGGRVDILLPKLHTLHIFLEDSSPLKLLKICLTSRQEHQARLRELVLDSSSICSSEDIESFGHVVDRVSLF